MEVVETLGQLLRFGVVGIASNAILYLFYLGMTHIGIGYVLAATIAYVVGVGQTFLFNRAWSFRHRVSPGRALVRYVIAYAIGYLANLLALLVLVDHLGYSHQWVQGFVILTLALFLFAMQKYWVFRQPTLR